MFYFWVFLEMTPMSYILENTELITPRGKKSTTKQQQQNVHHSVP